MPNSSDSLQKAVVFRKENDAFPEGGVFN